jgi:hypothetical protein
MVVLLTLQVNVSKTRELSRSVLFLCRDCTGFVYERADCSGFGGPTNTGICIQIRDSVVSWPSPGAEMGSLNPFAQ